jgi:hypothetical protein
MHYSAQPSVKYNVFVYLLKYGIWNNISKFSLFIELFQFISIIRIISSQLSIIIVIFVVIAVIISILITWL